MISQTYSPALFLGEETGGSVGQGHSQIGRQMEVCLHEMVSKSKHMAVVGHFSMPELGKVSCSEVEGACLRADSAEELRGLGVGHRLVSCE